MEQKRLEAISQYRVNVLKANKEQTKKDHFKDLLHRLFGGQQSIDKVLDQISAGSETTILSIPRNERVHRGSADTLFNKVIIEFEADLKKSGKHARQQLAGYLLGQFATGDGYNYTLIASDLIKWEIYYPSIEQIPLLGTLQEHELVLEKDEDSSFELTDGNEEEFYYWLDRFLFKDEKQRATLKRIEVAFGYQSQTFIECFRILSGWFKEAKRYGDVQVSVEQWRRFLSIAYGKFEGSEETFMVHTYLSVFSKLLAYSVVSEDDYIDDEELQGILDGTIFFKFGVRNFIDNDFFGWVCQDRSFAALKRMFRVISQEIVNFDFTDTNEDILKGVYQELIDLDTRHALGEYYTPDWLCERVLSNYRFEPSDRILDPSCGSGSFLRAAVHRLRQDNPTISIEELNDAVYGIDIHPLSVQIAKTTLLIAYGKEVSKIKKPMRLNVLMANTLLTPDGAVGLFGNEFTVQIDKYKEVINTKILEDPKQYDEMLELCEQLATDSQSKPRITFEAFDKIVSGMVKSKPARDYNESFYKIYLALKKTKEDGRDSIWKFILSNTYRPFFMAGKFNYIIGNPPWFTYSSIKNIEYQEQLLELANKYNIKPQRGKNMPHLEIAAIFMAHCTSYFLNNNHKKGQLAFVLPRSFYAGDQHENTRNGKALGFKISQIWDLDGVNPLFRIPSCVLFAEKAPKALTGDYDQIPGIELRARLPQHNASWEVAKDLLKEQQVIYRLNNLGKATAWSTQIQTEVQQPNPYKALFKQGATIVPRTFYFVDLANPEIADISTVTTNIMTAKAVVADAKMPWKDVSLKGFMEGRYLFRTALSRSILPYCIYKPDLVTLPIKIEEQDQTIKMLHDLELLYDGGKDAYKWFTNCKNIWEIHRTDKSKSMSASDRINYQRGLESQPLSRRYIVIYNASAKDANAGVLDRQTCDLPFILESVGYGFYTDNPNEAYYLTALLNSQRLNLEIKDFQAKGSFGPRHVHKKILDVYFPKYDSNNDAHALLATRSKDLSAAISQFLHSTNAPLAKSSHELGKLRLLIKEQFQADFDAVESLVAASLKV